MRCSRLLWAPGELGLAEAYITGDIDIEGDLATGLRAMRHAVRERGLRPPRPGRGGRLRALGTALRMGAVGPRPPVPAARAGLHGVLHSKARDRAAVSHHYDLSNAFYALLLDETMAYPAATGPVTPPATAPRTRSATSSNSSAASWDCARARGCWTSAAAGDR